MKNHGFRFAGLGAGALTGLLLLTACAGSGPQLQHYVLPQAPVVQHSVSPQAPVLLLLSLIHI